MVVKPIKFSLFKFGKSQPVTVLVYFINYQFKTTLLFTDVYTKIIHRGVILSSAKLVLSSCNQGPHINHLTLPKQPRKVVTTATSDYHSHKQPPLVAIATHHNTISLSFWILELLTLGWLQHWIVDMKAKRWRYLNVYVKNLSWNLKPLTVPRISVIFFGHWGNIIFR